ncbi:MAG: thiazole biosynthesis protein [Phycisphaerae bacterium]|nr:thiazole biosynthesis protein [Phycisphaerae bacterium]
MFDEIQISKAIAEAYHRKVLNHLASDVIIVGAGPSGLTAAYYLARSGLKVTVMEKRLSPGGGIWGGGMAMNEVVLQEEALQIADEFGIRHVRTAEGLHTADSVELACALCLKALQAGAAVLNLLTVEDIRVQQGKVNGVVVNRTGVYPTLHVDPITFSAGAVLDATGHEAILVATLKKKGLFKSDAGEGPMDAMAGEAFVVDRAGQVFPGLWVSGMGVCATFGGPRMGPIFGGMLLSGRRIAEMIGASLAE